MFSAEDLNLDIFCSKMSFVSPNSSVLVNRYQDNGSYMGRFRTEKRVLVKNGLQERITQVDIT